MSLHSSRIILSAQSRFACLIFFGALACALHAADAGTRTFDLPSGSAETTLQQFSEQSGVDLAFATDQVKGVTTNAVKGDLQPIDALKRMVAGTPLVVVKDEKPGAYAIRREGANGPNVQRAAAMTADRPSQEAQIDTGESGVMSEYVVKDTKPFMGSDFDLPRSVDEAQPYYIWDSAQIENSGATDVQSFFQRMVPMDTNHASLAQQVSSPTGSLSNISLNGLNGNNGATVGTINTLILVNGLPLPSIAYTGGANYEPDLNGIPLSAIDHIEVLPASASATYGASASGGVVNIVLKHDYNGLELSYSYNNTFGTDAPTRNVSLTGGLTLEGGKTHVLFSASYQTQKPVLVQDRLQIVGPYYRRLFSLYPGGELGYLTSGLSSAPGVNEPFVTSSNGSPLFAGSSATIVQVPAGYQQGQGLAPLNANIGNYDFSHPPGYNPTGVLGLLTPLTQGPMDKSYSVLLRRQMTPWLEAYAQFSDSSVIGYQNYDAFTFSGITVPATAAGNPFGQAVKVSGVLTANAPPGFFNDSVTHDLSAGAKIRLPWNWNADLNYTWGTSALSLTQDVYDSAALQAAVTSGTVNLIADLNRFPVNPLAFEEVNHFSNIGSIDALQLKAAGPLLKLWAGNPSLAAGIEHEKSGNSGGALTEVFAGDPTIAAETIYYPGASMTDDSGYAELTFPLLERRNGIFGVDELELQATGRFDAIREHTTAPVDVVIEQLTNGTTTTSPNLLTGGLEPFTPATTSYNATNETVGLKYRPVRDVLLRGSYSTALVPPTYSQLLSPVSAGTQRDPQVSPPAGVPTTSPWIYTLVTDPLFSATQYDVPTVMGGNPGLKPETAYGYDWGVVLEPSFARGLRISLDFTRTTKQNDIITPTTAQIIADPADFPGRLVRAAPSAGQAVGPIVLMNTSSFNAPETVTSSYNLEADYVWRTASAGTWKIFATGNSWQHYEIQSIPGGPFVEQLGNPNVTTVTPGFGIGAGLAKFKANLGLNWTMGPFSAGWLVRYVGPYTQGSYYGLGGPDAYEEGTVNGWVSSQIYHDVFVGYKIGPIGAQHAAWRRMAAGLSLQLGVKNVFDHYPPYDGLGSSALYSTYGDVDLATYYFTVKKAF